MIDWSEIAWAAFAILVPAVGLLLLAFALGVA